MQKWLKFNEWRRIWVHRTSNIEIQKGRQNNSDILQNWLPLEIRFPFFNLQKFLDPQKSTPDSCTNEWSRIWIYKTFEIEIKKRGPNNADILQNWFPPEIRSPLYNLPKLQDYEKSTPDSCRNDWNLMNDEEFGSILLLWLKYKRRGTK